MKKSCLMFIILLTGLCALVQMGRPARAEAGVIKTVVCYVPNRVFDLLDIFRVRVRVGPGISAGVRATRPVSGFLGFHSSAFIGLPGPRGSKKLPLPVGFDVRGGAQASLVDATEGAPYYDPLEVGFETQLFLPGVNVGVGVFEIFDFITGFVFIDLQDDDFGKSAKKDDKEKNSKAAEEVEAVEKEEPAPSEEDMEPAEEVEAVEKEEPAPSEEDMEPAEEVEAVEKEEPAPSEEDMEPAEEMKE